MAPVGAVSDSVLVAMDILLKSVPPNKHDPPSEAMVAAEMVGQITGSAMLTDEKQLTPSASKATRTSTLLNCLIKILFLRNNLPRYVVTVTFTR